MLTPKEKQEAKNRALRDYHAELAKSKLTHFATFTDPLIENEWFHRIVYNTLDEQIAQMSEDELKEEFEKQMKKIENG